MIDNMPAELPAEVASRISDERIDLIIEGKHELWNWEMLLPYARWLAVAGERLLLPIFSYEAQFAVVRVLAHADHGPLVVMLQVIVPAFSNSKPSGVLILAEHVVGVRSPGSPGTFLLPRIYHELYAEIIEEDLVVAKDVLPAVCGAVALEGYRVRLLFNDGTVRDVDLAPYIAHGPIFEPLRIDPAYFRAFRVAGGTLTWPNGADIAPETLYALDPPAVEGQP